jgi:type II secretory pathway pseudopilin PulG
MKNQRRIYNDRRSKQAGFSIVEILVASIIFPIIMIGLTGAANAVRQQYAIARQLNEIYTVLSACPEIDRALDYNAISSTTNCYPNNSFPAEDGSTATVTYTPSLTVTPSTSLPSSDPFYNLTDSKVLDITVGWQRPYTSFPNLELRMLIARNGIGQQ